MLTHDYAYTLEYYTIHMIDGFTLGIRVDITKRNTTMIIHCMAFDLRR